MASATAWGQAVGDYGSAASGNWTANGTWVVCVTAGTWVGATAATAATTSSTNVWILNGHTVVFDVSAKVCNNLTIESGGKLWCNVANTTNRYIRVYGSTVTNNGIFGGSNDGLCLAPYSANLTLTGAGSYGINRIQHLSTLISPILVFDADALVTYAGTSGTGGSSIYCNGIDNVTFTVNIGKTVTTATLSYIAIGTSGSSTPATGLNITLNVNGTLTTGTNAHINLLNASSKTSTINIGSQGTLNCGGNLLMPAATSTGVLNVANGGAINFNSAVTFNLGAATTSTINGIFDCGLSSTRTIAGSTTIGSTGKIRLMDGNFPVGITQTTGSMVEYYGTAPITMPATPATYENLVIGNAEGVTLSGSVSVNGALALMLGNLILGDNNLTLLSPVNQIILNPAPEVIGHIVTNGTGSLIQTVVPASGPIAGLFPIGTLTSYDPVTITPLVPTEFSARVSSTLTGTPAPGYQYNPKEWNITPTLPAPSPTVITMKPSDITATGPFNIIGHYEGGDYVNKLATLSAGSYTGTYDTFSPFVTGSSDTPTGLNNTKSTYFVSVSGGEAIVNGTNAGDVLNVFNTSGQLVKQMNAGVGTTAIKLNRGIYLIKLNNNTLKVII